MGWEMCGEECPPSEWTETYSADPWAMTMYEPCGTTHYTMVRIYVIKSSNFVAEKSSLCFRFTPPHTQIMPSGTARLTVDQNRASLVFSLSLSSEGKQQLLVIKPLA